ncbi:tetratricopeptide repeat protein [Kitasatospora sp. NPDC058063]|uniref:tetratricopeptide repeat protein n=1 Tax=unclassified Kitasatospora TaxID=2633591 RepID=UPI0036DBD7EA
MQNGGALADLTMRLRELHLNAGEPSTRRIAAGTAGAVSHSTVHQALTGRRLPRWGALELIVEALGGDPEEFRAAWKSARLQEDRPEEPADRAMPAGSRRYRLSEGTETGLGRQRIAYRIAERMLDSGNHQEAAEFLKKEFEGSPRSSLTVLYLRALAKSNDSGITAVLKMLRGVDMESADAAEAVADYLEDHLGDVEASLGHMLNALRLDPGNGLYAWSVAGYLDYLNRPEEALPYYRRGAELFPTDNLCVAGCARALVKAGQFAEAERVARSSGSDDIEVKEWLAQALALQGKFDEAEQELRPLTDRAYIAQILARILLTAERYDDALKLVERRVDDDHVGLAFQATYLDVLIAAGRTEEAERRRARLEAQWWEREGRRS